LIISHSPDNRHKYIICVQFRNVIADMYRLTGRTPISP